MKELSKERIRGRAAVDGAGYQDINDASWSFSDAGLQKFAAAIIKEDRALNAPADRDVMRQAVNALLNQIDIGDFVDSHGHSAKMLKPVHDLMQMLSVPTPPAEQPTKVETTYARQHAAHEAELTAMIEERDHREEIIDQLCDAVLGPDRAEWSSNYYFEDAVSEVQERIAELETCKECRESNMSAEQGEQEPVATVNSMDGHTNTKWLTKLPDGQHNLYIRPAPDVLATLRAEVKELPDYRGVSWAVNRNDVLALIDKMGGAA